MSNRRSAIRVLGVGGGVAVVALLLLVILGFPWSALAQQSPGAPSVAEAPLPEGYVGAETCKACHDDQYVGFEKTRMGRLFLKHPRDARERLACEGCHGPGKVHVQAGGGKGVGGLITFSKDDKTPVQKRNQVCLSCHTKGARLFWQGSAHDSRGVACTNCHTVMTQVSPKAQLAKTNEIETCGACHPQKRAQTMRSSHMPLREGKMTCTSCHNPHGTATRSLLREIGLNETCYRCHAEKRGPLLWTHAPVLENCANCHDPHGSNHESLLKVAKPRLCQQCHITSGHPINPYGRGDTASLKFVMGRQCVDCHQLIHGSNHPAGKFFER